MKEVYKSLCPVDILAIGVHPDDVELCASGTLLKHRDMGYSIAVADLTEGELGTRGDRETRLIESNRAAQIMDLSFRVNLGMEDGFFRTDRNHILQIARLIRAVRPKIILANALDDRHPDHGRAAHLVREAFFFSGLQKIVELEGEAFRANALYHYIQDKNLTPDFCVDVTGYENLKMEAIGAYSTQFFQENMEGPSTPISSPQFLDFIKSKMAVYGRPIGVDFAEGFNVHRTPGVENLLNLS